MNIQKVSVLGAGTMGNQIALQCAVAGYRVVCYDISGPMLERAAAFADRWLKNRVEKGKMEEATAEEIRDRLRFTSDLRMAAEGADIALEAVSDIVEVKIKALSAFDALAPERCIYASNSSYIVSSRFAHAVRDPSKVLNVHFFNPALVMKVVEVVRGPHVSRDTFDDACAFVESIGKTPVKIEKEIYGFVVNRIFSALTREACYLVDMGIAAPEDIDMAVKGALGHSMGPLETLDMTGIDLEYHVYMERFRASGDKADLPAACLAEHYAKGEYGRKSGKGFYDYNQQKGPCDV